MTTPRSKLRGVVTPAKAGVQNPGFPLPAFARTSFAEYDIGTEASFWELNQEGLNWVFDISL